MAEANKIFTVGLLGGDRAGISTLLDFIAGVAKRGGAGGRTGYGCEIRMKGVELRLVETHLRDFERGRPAADCWYLVVDAGEGIGALGPDFRAMGIERVEGIFLAKCDLIDYDDEIIELEKIDARSCFYENGLPEDCGVFIAGSVFRAMDGERAAGVDAVAGLLQSIVSHIP